MYCAISNQVPECPVVSTKSGIVFEKRLIESYISENHKCPIKGHELEKEDLLVVEAVPGARPRPASQQSLPGLLQAQQAEWDAVMLENFQLRKQLDLVRQELSHALYRHDASCRVIARLMKERDTAQKALSELQSEAASAAPRSQPTQTNGKQIPKDVFDKMIQAHKELSSKRKKREIPSDLATKEALANMKEVSSVAPHSTTTPGITSVDAHNGTIVTGGMDGAVIVLNADNEVQQKLTAHTKPVRRTLLSRASGKLITTSDDCTVKVWNRGPRGFATVAEFKDNKQPVSGVDVNPTGDVLLTCSADSVVAMYDISATGNGRTLVKLQEDDVQKGFTSCSFHPDGVLVACGMGDGGANCVRIWDLRSMKTFGLGEEGLAGINTLSFSENGYTMATGGVDGVVAVWDLRSLKKLKSFTFDDSDPSRPTPVNKVTFDLAGIYLAICTDSVKIYDVKTTSEITTLRQHASTVTDCVWGPLARTLYSTSLDRQLKTYSI
eukprot:TRINITY_DN23607_c0_g1_i1.p1 TRINITY_DN23607_c0_g1~~TRINITY_DN23607_c0_g1_i1.p1  ORF type:complete len:496 (+),score=159.46 TRINITY_DN23607_c0_g1_i1:45-1532(+)